MMLISFYFVAYFGVNPANLSPLPPFFKKSTNSSLPTLENCCQRDEKSTHTSAETSGDFTDVSSSHSGRGSTYRVGKYASPRQFWVQCNYCQKWRLLPNSCAVDIEKYVSISYITFLGQSFGIFIFVTPLFYCLLLLLSFICLADY